VVRVESVTSAGGRKGTLTCGLSFLSLPVATPQFPTSCGIDTGSEGGGELQPPLSRSSDNAAHGEIRVVGDRLMDRPLRGGLSFRWCVSPSDQSLTVARLGGRAYSSNDARGHRHDAADAGTLVVRYSTAEQNQTWRKPRPRVTPVAGLTEGAGRPVEPEPWSPGLRRSSAPSAGRQDRRGADLPRRSRMRGVPRSVRCAASRGVLRHEFMSASGRPPWAPCLGLKVPSVASLSEG
jgi:hypothetical protein